MTGEREASEMAVDTIWSQAAGIFVRWVEGHDPAALDELVRGLTPSLWQIARACGLDRVEAEDVVQTTWLTLVRHRESLREPQAVAAWLSTTTRRQAWKVKRRSGRSVPHGDDFVTDSVSVAPSAEREAVNADESGRLWAAVATLDERCRYLLRLVAFTHRPDYGEVAAELDMPVGSVGPTRGRCLKKLKNALEKEGFRDD